MEVLRLQAIEKPRTSDGFIPRIEFCWKNVWSPDVVAVFVTVRRRRIICRDT